MKRKHKEKIINNNFISSIVKSIENEVGKGKVFDDENEYTSTVKKVISTDCLSLDRICCKTLKNKIGLPVGRIIEVVGPEGCSKSTLVYHIAKNIYLMNGINTLFECEHRYDDRYPKNIGAKFHIKSQPDYLENMMDGIISALKEIIRRKHEYKDKYNKLKLKEEKLEKKNKKLSNEELITKKKYLKEIKKIYGFFTDSIAALPSKAEFDKRKTSGMGEHARIISQSLRIISKLIARAGAIWIVVNQERWNMSGRKITFGGESLRYYSSIRIRLSKLGVEGTDESDNEADSIRVLAKTIKNNVNKPFRNCEFIVDFGKGINYWKSIALYLEKREIITTSGSWKHYRYKKNKEISWQNEKGLNKKLTDKIRKQWIKKVKE